MARNGTIEAIFDEAVARWLDPALQQGMRALPLGATTVERLEPLGFRRNTLDRADYPLLPPTSRRSTSAASRCTSATTRRTTS